MLTMALTKEDVEKIANLARLDVTAEEVADYQTQLSAILDHVAQLAELDLSDLEPTAHAVAQQNVMRADVIKPSLTMDEVLHNAANHAENQFAIQAVLDDS